LQRLEYRFEVDGDAQVKGGSYAAVAQGTSTLLQAIFEKDRRFGLPRLAITDQPVPKYTGLMVDLARVYHSPDSLKQQIELCRVYRVEYLRWHLNDMESWTIPSAKYPLLGTKNWGAFGLKPPRLFTRAELDDIVAYADARGVSLVPEVEVPFHAGSIVAVYPNLRWDGGHVHIAKEELYTFLDGVIGEMAEIFPSSSYIHVGGDEFSFDFNALAADSPAFMAAHDIHSLGDNIAYLASKLNEFVKKRGKKAMAWAPTQQAPKDLAMNVWGSNDDPQAWMAAGFPVINTPAVPGWFETPRYSYEIFGLYKKEDRVITDTSNALFLGADQVYWERGEERMMQYLRDTVAARAERSRNPALGRSFADFSSRLAKTDAILDKLLYRFTTRVEGIYERGSVESDGKKDYRVPDGGHATVTMTPGIAGAKIRYTTGNYTENQASAVDPGASSPEYTAPISIAAGKSLQLRAALFDSAGKQLGMTYRATFNGNLTRNLDGLW
jgi:hexosaminidase